MVELMGFLPDPPKSFLSKMKRKIRHYFWTKMPMHGCTWACPRCFFSFFFFFFFFFFHLDVAPSSFFLLFFFFNLLGRLPTRPSSSLLFSFFSFFLFSFAFLFCFFVLFRCDFFSRREFYFLINLGDLFFFFFGCLSIFWF